MRLRASLETCLLPADKNEEFYGRVFRMKFYIAMLFFGYVFAISLVLLTSNVDTTDAKRASAGVYPYHATEDLEYCDLELNCEGDMQTSTRLPIRQVRGPPGPQGMKGEKGETGRPGMPGPSAPAPPKIAFFVGLTENVGPFSVNSTLVFDRILTNVGGAYDFDTGHFRSPVSGTYQFSVAVSSVTGEKAAVRLYKNEERVATVWCTSRPSWTTSSNTFFLTLEKDDLVWLMALTPASHFFGNMYTTFSGCLIFEN